MPRPAVALVAVLLVSLTVTLAACARGRFVAAGDGVVRDRRTGLEWTSRDHAQSLAWTDADRHCRELPADATRGAWRLPELAEIEGLYDPAHDEPCGDRQCHVDPAIRLGGPYVWTATARGEGARFYVDLGHGTSFSPGIPPTLVRRVLCVRGAPSGAH